MLSYFGSKNLSEGHNHAGQIDFAMHFIVANEIVRQYNTFLSLQVQHFFWSSCMFMLRYSSIYQVEIVFYVLYFLIPIFLHNFFCIFKILYSYFFF